MSDIYNITYHFNFESNKKFSYSMNFDRKSGLFLSKASAHYPSWTKLEHNQCEHCPLNKKDVEYCPVATNISEIVEAFTEETSFNKVEISVETRERTYIKNTDMQTGLFGVMGLIMATSECPSLSFLRPMARFHLPFATIEETLIRSVSFFLLGHYINNKEDKNTFSLEKLSEYYLNIKKVNRGFSKRVKSVAKKDADINALIILYNFSEYLSIEISENLSSLEKYFKSAS